MRILHVHDHAYFQGGVEQILFDTACGLSEQGCPQALLHSGDSVDLEFKRPFQSIDNEISIIDLFKPDAVLIHKVADPSLAAEMGLAGVAHVKQLFLHPAYLDQIKHQMEKIQ